MLLFEKYTPTHLTHAHLFIQLMLPGLANLKLTGSSVGVLCTDSEDGWSTMKQSLIKDLTNSMLQDIVDACAV